MVDWVLLLALGLLGGAPLALAPWPTAAAAIACAVAARKRASRFVIGLALVALVIGGLRARVALSHADTVIAAATALAKPPSRCVGEGIVASSPVVLRQGHEPSDLGDARVDVDLVDGSCDDRAIASAIRARIYGAPPSLARGDRIALAADLAPVYLFANEDLPDARASIARSGVAISGGAVDVRLIARSWSIASFIDRARYSVRKRIDATYDADAAPLARALVLGEDDLDPTDDEAFRVSGLAHLLAVSGTHLIIAVLTFTALLRAVLARVPCIAGQVDPARIAAAVTIPVAWAYADFAGGSGSAVRAAAMLTASMIVTALGRKPSTVRSLAWSLAGAAIVDPLIATDVSFALSAASTAGLIAFQKPIAELLARGPAALKKILAAVATTIAAMIGCTPVMLLFVPTIPLLGVLANLIAAPIGELAALPLCLAHAILSFFPAAERGAALAGSGALLAVRAVARASASTGAVLAIPVPTRAELAVLVTTVFAIGCATGRTKRLGIAGAGVAALVVAELIAIDRGAPQGVLRVTVLDVGQGDSLLVDLPDGKLMIVDGGGFVGSPIDPGTRVLLPVLRARRRRRVDIAVLTHPHPDHFTGLASALPQLDVGEVWDTGQGEAMGAGATYAGLLAGLRARGVPIRRPDEVCGRHEFGGAAIDVLAPCPRFDPSREPNDNSFVLRVTMGDRAALLVGDAEEAEEKLLLASGENLHADFLKVGHHGSRTSSSPAFLAAVSPAFAAISTGVRNRFGHPHPIALAAFAARSLAPYRTDRDGEVVWETDGRKIRVRLLRPAR